MQRIKYPSINGLRAISIILVIIGHIKIKEDIFLNANKIIFLQPITSFLSDSHLGVNVFFVISGFLITSLLSAEETNTKKISVKKIYFRRILRIFPAYYFLLLIYFLLQLSGYLKIGSYEWLTALTFTKYFNWTSDWYTSHGWSLSIEEHFYLFWPLVFIFGIKFRKRIALFLVFLVPLIRWCLYFPKVNILFCSIFPNINSLFELTFFGRIDAIALGCIFALYKDQIITIISPHWNKIFYSSIFTILFLRYMPYFTNMVHLNIIWGPLGLMHGSIANLAIALILMYSVFGPKGLWYKFLNTRILNYIGILSYSIYLWQQLFLGYSLISFSSLFLNLVFILAVAIFSYHCIEKPFLNLKTGFYSTEKVGNTSPRFL